MFAMQGSLTAVLTNAWVKQNLGNSVSVWPRALKINSSWNSCRGFQITWGMERLDYGERLKFLFCVTVKMKIDRKYDCCLVYRRVLI